MSKTLRELDIATSAVSGDIFHINGSDLLDKRITIDDIATAVRQTMKGALIADGDVTIESTGVLKARSDEDVMHELGKVKIGGIGGLAYFSHFSLTTTSAYAVAQAVGGDTFVNAKTGSSVFIRNNNGDVAAFGGTAILFNKGLTVPTIATTSTASFGGAVTITSGILTVNSSGITSSTSLINFAKALSVTGAITASGAGNFPSVAVSGLGDFDTLDVSGAATAASVAIAGLGTFGTITSTGLATLGGLSVAADTYISVSIGYGRFGYISGSYTDFYISHKDANNALHYGLLLKDTTTSINAEDTVYIRQGNDLVGSFSSSAIFFNSTATLFLGDLNASSRVSFTSTHADISQNTVIKGSLVVTEEREKFNKQNNTGIIIPMYIYPADIFNNTTYNNLIAYAKAYSDIPIVVILNPSNGPGTVTDGNYTYAIRRLQGANITVLGYVSTDYAVTPIGTVKSDVADWKLYYPDIDGIFFDEMTYATSTSNLEYYKELNDYVKQSDLTMTVTNPGSPFSGDYQRENVADIIIGWESTDYPTLTQMKEDYANGSVDYSKNKRGALVHTQSAYDAATAKTLAKYYGWIYITEDNISPNPWDALSSYLTEMYKSITRSVYTEYLEATEAIIDDLTTTDIEVTDLVASSIDTSSIDTNTIVSHSIDTGHGAVECYEMDQDVTTDDEVTFDTVNSKLNIVNTLVKTGVVTTEDPVPFQLFTIGTQTQKGILYTLLRDAFNLGYQKRVSIIGSLWFSGTGEGWSAIRTIYRLGANTIYLTADAGTYSLSSGDTDLFLGIGSFIGIPYINPLSFS